MNSEELEQSLRTEFESYLKTVLAEMRQEATEFQTKVAVEVDKHIAQLDEAFKAYHARFDSEHAFDEAFRGSVAEHLRLARDEGARITANAMTEAEKLNETAPPVAAKYDGIRDAVTEISGKDSQSAILKSLVQHAAEFAPRGAFFIIKNEHFVGWKVFGTDDEKAEEAIREIHFATAENSILGSSVRSLSTISGAAGYHPGDSLFLEPLHFGHPDRMYSVPLVARGRVVAVLYADHGADGTDLNLEALETLVRVAGLTVELLAATQTAKAENRPVAKADFEDAHPEENARPEMKAETPAPASMPVAVVDSEPKSFAFSESVSYQGGFPAEETVQEYDISAFEAPAAAVPQPFEVENAADEPFRYDQPMSPEIAFGYDQPTPVAHHHELPAVKIAPEPAFTEYAPVQESPFETNSRQPFESARMEVEPVARVEDTAGAMVFDSADVIEPAPVRLPVFERPIERYEPAAVVSGGYMPSVEPMVVEAPPPAAPKARLSDRPVDLPIEVPEDERRIHNDARRFARLLVSEIKLYNEKKVLEGREGNDLYERLREAIDRSREMYDKRVQPPVAAKFDYFHYEIVNSLAEGQADRLGVTYPGASV